MAIHTRLAQPDDFPRLTNAYAAWGYGGSIAPGDVVLVAEEAGAPVGIVRQTIEHGVVMLRGMYVAPEARGRGIGSALLDAFTLRLDGDQWLRAQPCFGIPYAHLETFYGRAGFRFVRADTAPAFLQARLAAYTAEGRVMGVMRRPPSGVLHGEDINRG